MAADEGDGRERACATLTRALEDEDATVRGAAVVVRGATDAYVDAFLRRLEAKDPALSGFYGMLPYLADRAAFAKRIEALFDGYAIAWTQGWDPPHEAAALLLARRIAKELKNGSRDKALYNVAYRCAGKSPKAAAGLLLLAMEVGDTALVQRVDMGMGERDQVQYLAEEALALRTAALAGDGDASVQVLDMLGIGPADLPAVADALRRREGRGLPAYLFRSDVLTALGPGQAGALVSYCRDGKQVARLLVEGRAFATRDDAGADFFRQVIPRAGPEAADSLRKLAETDALAGIVAERLLAADGPEWGWTVNAPLPDRIRADRQAGPFVWNRMQERGVFTALPAARALVAPRTDDRRIEVAMAAVSAAGAEKNEAALRKALEAPRADVRGTALGILATSAADAPAIVRGFAARKDLTAEDRRYVANAIFAAKGPAMAAVAADLIRAEPAWDLLWAAYSAIAPKAAAELAAGSAPTAGSLRVLVNVDDPRRIAIFRDVLKGADQGNVGIVLQAVYDQFLVELGEETLAQLRSPDDNNRQIAKGAIEKLKFYAEAKKAFEK